MILYLALRTLFPVMAQDVGIGQFFVFGAILGFWYSPVLLRRYCLTQRMKKYWGWPQFTVVDLMSLTVWIAVIAALANNAMQFRPIKLHEYPVRPIVINVVGLALILCIYLWFRAAWLLEQCQIRQPSRRLVFFLVILPAALLANVDAGLSVVTVISILFAIAFVPNEFSAAFAIFGLLICPPVELILLTVLIRRGMNFVLQEKVQPEPDAIE